MTAWLDTFAAMASPAAPGRVCRAVDCYNGTVHGLAEARAVRYGLGL